MTAPGAGPADRLPPRPERPDLVFVGGTGRSGTHVVSKLLNQHSRYRKVPIEVRFHVNPLGFPDLLAGRITLEQFLRKLRRFWWRRIRAGEVAPAVLPRLPLGRTTRGLFKIVPRQRFDAAVAEFESAYPDDPPRACRNLFLDLLWPLAVEAGKPGLVEKSCFVIAQAPTVLELFPEAKLIHTVRDGRDAGASKVAKRQKRTDPSTPREGIDWWAERLRAIEEGVRAVPSERLLAVSLDDLVTGDREGTLARILDFADIEEEPAVRQWFETTVSPGNLNSGRWRSGLSDEEKRAISAHYERTLERLDAEGYHCVPLLRRAYELQPA